MTDMKDIRSKSDSELVSVVEKARETLRQERFKESHSRKKSVIDNAKKDIARALTEQTVRRTKSETK